MSNRKKLVDVRVFVFVVARALVTDIERLHKAGPNGQLQPNDILNFFIDGQKGESSFDANLLFALEGLVAPAFSHPLCLFCITCLALLFLPVLSQPHTTFDGSKLTDDIRDENRRVMVEGGVVHIMKALAQHPVAAQSLAEDDSLQLMFHMIALGDTIPMLSHSDSFKKIAATTPPLHLAQLHRHVMQILGLLLTSDNGSTAKYIETHELRGGKAPLEILLKTLGSMPEELTEGVYLQIQQILEE
ncbi:hypothetical protein CY35_04G001700 [Sphagnum magellanicum]|nr:hypothetical protein CY35_04G001700 [Sphagnum magellanicum]